MKLVREALFAGIGLKFIPSSWDKMSDVEEATTKDLHDIRLRFSTSVKLKFVRSSESSV